MTQLNELQNSIWLDRYALKGADGLTIESDIDQTFRRVASAIGNDEKERDAFYTLLQDFKFVPGGRILAGAGAETEKTFYNCYVIPVETEARRANRSKDGYHSQRRDAGCDSREAIFDTRKTMVDIMSRGGGVGINWSCLRPSGSYLTRVSGTSSGPIGWMDAASYDVGTVIQGGSRRGAAMFMLDDWHPDVLDFIDAKRTQGKITNANISVSVSDDFMAAVEADSDWTTCFPDTTHPAYNTEWDGDISEWKGKGYPVVDYGTYRARDVWRRISESAHESGEPGVVFLDRYNQLSTANGQERIISVNPCGEQGLGAYSVCNLGAMNLDAYVDYLESDVTPEFDWKWFEKDVRQAIRFLDNVIDKTFYFIPETKERQGELRRIGLGVMGLADALVRLGIRYGTPQAVEFTERVFREMKDAAIEQSMTIADLKGPSRGWTDDMWERPFLAEYRERWGHRTNGAKMRNLFLHTQAPTGTTSLLANVNSGIEPYFSLKTWRQDRTGGRYVYAKAVEDLCDDGHPDDVLPSYVVTAQDVTVEEHICMQAAAQKYIDSSVSKTINAPAGQTVEETQKAFNLAYSSGCKGIAYYRDGSRSVQVLYNENPNVVIANLEAKIKELSAKLAFRDATLLHEGMFTQTYMHVISEGEGVLTGLDRDDVCPACRTGAITFEEGCKKCYSCGWSAC